MGATPRKIRPTLYSKRVEISDMVEGMSTISSFSKNLRRTTAALFASLLAVASMTVGAAPASAHDALIESNPADGETLTQTTDTIVLTFNNTIAEIGGKIQVTPASGQKIEADLTAQGKDAVLELPQPLANDDYTVSWRVVSSDSHAIEGEFAFIVNDPENAPLAPEETATPEPTASESSEATTEPSQTTEEDSQLVPAAPGDEATHEDSSKETSTNWVRVAIFGALGAAVGVLLLVIGNKRGRKN